MADMQRKHRQSHRFSLMAFLLVATSVATIVRLGYLQIREAPQLAHEVVRPFTASSPVPATRGSIEVKLDNGQIYPLVSAEGSNFEVTFTPGAIPDQSKLHQIEEQNAVRLSSILLPYFQAYWRANTDATTHAYPIDSEGRAFTHLPTQADVTSLLLYNEAYDMPSSYIRTLNAFNENLPTTTLVPIDLPTQQHISGMLDQLPGVDLTVGGSSQTFAAQGNTLMGKDFMDHVVGNIGLAPPAGTDKRYVANLNMPHGISGLELYYDKELAGQPGKQQVVVDHNGQIIQPLQVIQPPKNGDSLLLGVQPSLQQVAEFETSQLFKKGMQKGGKPQSASIIVINPTNGQILAMAEQSPLYSPNGLYPPIQGAYNPGSTAKPATIAMALSEGIISPDTSLYDSGSYSFGGTAVHEWGPGGPTGLTITPATALTHSSNVFLSMVGDQTVRFEQRKTGSSYIGAVGPAVSLLTRYDHAFGLGVATGIDWPDESVGVADAIDAQAAFNSGAIRMPFDFAIAGFGQIVQYTPLELAQYVSALATGERVAPHFVEALQTPGGKILPVVPKVLNHVPVSSQTLALIRQGMVGVTQPGGTAWTAFVGTPYTVAAKTGTAQTNGGRGADNAIFMGYAPANHPQIAVVIAVPQAGLMGADVAQAARDLFDVALQVKPADQILGHPPFEPTGTPDTPATKGGAA